MSSRIASWKNWLIILAILIGTGLLTALWPLLTSPIGRRPPRIPAEVPIVEISLPVAIAGTSHLELSGFLVVALLAVIVVGAVLAMGVPLAFIYVLLSRQTTTVVESDEFKTQQAALERKGAERIKQLRQERTTAPMPQHKMPRWSVVSTSLIILLFVAFLAMLINAAFFPEGMIEVGHRLVNSAIIVVGGSTLFTLLILLLWVRPQRLDAVEATDRGPIPWDFIWVLISGLLVVGLGIGITLYLHMPA